MSSGSLRFQQHPVSLDWKTAFSLGKPRLYVDPVPRPLFARRRVSRRGPSVPSWQQQLGFGEQIAQKRKYVSVRRVLAQPRSAGDVCCFRVWAVRRSISLSDVGRVARGRVLTSGGGLPPRVQRRRQLDGCTPVAAVELTCGCPCLPRVKSG